MSAVINFKLHELRRLAADKSSCVKEKKVIQNIALQPWCLGNLKESLNNLLNCKIGKFDKEFNGILLSYKNLRILQNVGSIRNDNADINFQVQADYFIFKPFIGATLKGIVNKKCHTHLGVLVHRVFNVVVPRSETLTDNEWNEIEEKYEVGLKIMALDLQGALPDIRGEMLQFSKKHSLHCDSNYESHVYFDKTKPPGMLTLKKSITKSKNNLIELDLKLENSKNGDIKTENDEELEKCKKNKRKTIELSEENIHKCKKSKKE